MSEHKRFFLLIIIMATVSAIVAGVTIFMLYRTAFNEEKARLVETAQSQARLIEAVARFDAQYSKDYPGGSKPATLSQIIDAHKHYTGFGETGEFTLSKKEGDNIVFLLSHRHYDLDKPKPIPFDSELAEPMRRALSGKSGTVIGLDYRGATVLAAHEPLGVLNLGIVAKIDLAEVRAPFLRAVLIAGGLGVMVVLIGTALFLRVSNPIIKRLGDSEANLHQLNQELEQRVETRTAELEEVNTQLEQEIEERKQVGEALQESELQVRLLLDSTAEAIYGLDMEGDCTFANAACLQLLGYETTDDLIGKNMHNLIHHTRYDDSPYPMEECRIYMAFKRGEGSHVDDEVLWRADGTSFWAEYWSYPIYRNDQVVGSVVTFLDITDRRRAEEKLREAHEKLVLQEKLAVLGQLAGGVGHELRNPLGVISNAVYYLKMVLPEADETVKEYLETISSEVDRSTVIVSDLLDLSRSRPAEKEVIAVSELINQALDRYRPPDEIEVVTEIPSELPPLFADPLQIGQVLNNLITNGCQAMPDGGKLTIKAKAQEEKVSVSVTDTGSGIYKDSMEKIFEPLFTTRARGIGLGLAVSKNLVEANEGNIEVESEAGKGSTFTVALPVKEVAS